MPEQQAKFKLVPETLAVQPANRPRMTSKQAKKAYRQATALPKISKAEQRRLEKEEIDRQKKEYEKEQARAKAKAGREKKAAKLQAEQDARRKRGEPEPRRGVRASQPFITGFVKLERGNKKRTLDDLESRDSTDMESERHGSEAPLKVRAVSNLETLEPQPHTLQQETAQTEKFNLETPRISTPPVATPELELLPIKTAQSRTPQTKPAQRDMPLRSGSTLVNSSNSMEPPLKTQTWPNKVPLAMALKESQDIDDEWGDWPSMSQGDFPALLAEADEISRSSTKSASGSLASNSNPISFPVLRDVKISPNIPPPSTMAFLEAHIDEFEYTPSQEIREILTDIDSIPSNSQVAQELAENSTVPDVLGFLCTQDLVISSQDLREIDTPNRTVKTFPRRAPLHVSSTQSRRRKPRFFEEKEEDLMRAALDESLKAQRPSQQTKRGMNSVREKRCVKVEMKIPVTDEDNYGSDELGSDELLAVLAAIER